MPFKKRTESEEIKILRLLNTRMALLADFKQHYINLVKGYEGECMFDSVLERAELDCKFFILNDLLLEIGTTTFQIDTLLITENSLILFEVKNYQGDYVYREGNFHNCATDRKITNPLHQLNRSETLLRQLLQKHGFQLPIEGQVIFINSEFHLYLAPLDQPIFYHSQLKKLVKNLSARPSNLNGGHRKLAEFLLKKHITKSPYTNLPPFNYDSLRKRITCACCNSFYISVCGKRGKCAVCSECGHQEDFEHAVVRTIEDYCLLFPDRKITISSVCDWLKLHNHKRQIKRILAKNFNVVGSRRHSYYVIKK